MCVAHINDDGKRISLKRKNKIENVIKETETIGFVDETKLPEKNS